MAPLSRALSGVILPHEHFGSHLDKSGKTVDDDLERVNFKYAGEVLADIWGNISLDNYPVVSKYIEPAQEEQPTTEDTVTDALWYAAHVRESNYLLQVC